MSLDDITKGRTPEKNKADCIGLFPGFIDICIIDL